MEPSNRFLNRQTLSGGPTWARIRRDQALRANLTPVAALNPTPPEPGERR